MLLSDFLFLVTAALSLGATVVIYNGLVALRNDCERAWSNIDVLLKQRCDEIPNLVSVCRGYMQHERETLERVTAARERALAAVTTEEVNAAGSQTAEAMADLFAVAEGYPDLKADRQFLRLQQRITGIESEIADRREYFNACVTTWNTRIQQLPDAFIARPLGWRPRPLLRFPEAHRRPSVAA